MKAAVISKPSTMGMANPDFESLVHRIIQSIDKDKLTELRRDFHTRLRITLNHPDNQELIEDLWDFFYDWCVFEQKIHEKLPSMTTHEQNIWNQMKDKNERGLYTILKHNVEILKIKECFCRKTYVVLKTSSTDFLGLGKGDLIEGRIVISNESHKCLQYSFIRRPSYHPPTVHKYIHQKVKQFRKAKDFSSYQNWLWLLVGMYLKHRIYANMPIDKIYDDQSRI